MFRCMPERDEQSKKTNAEQYQISVGRKKIGLDTPRPNESKKDAVGREGGI